MRETTLIVLVAAVTMAAGCQSGPKYRCAHRKISIDTNPSGAKVYQVGPLTEKEFFLGTTPLHEQSVAVLTFVDKTSCEGLPIMVSQLEMVRVQIVKDGFKKYESNLWTLDDETVKHAVKLEPSQ